MIALGGAIATAGVEKLARERGYVRLFKHLGWSKTAMRAVASAEVVGGVLMVPRATRRIGGAIVAAASAAVLVAEVRHGDALAAPRALVMLAGVYAAVTG
jgi:hypothetical protein